MLGLGRHAEYLDVAGRATLPSRRWEIGRTIALDDLVKAADMCARHGQRTTEAYLRLLAAERLAVKGGHRDAHHQVHRALAFHRTVGATLLRESGRTAPRHGGVTGHRALAARTERRTRTTTTRVRDPPRAMHLVVGLACTSYPQSRTPIGMRTCRVWRSRSRDTVQDLDVDVDGRHEVTENSTVDGIEPERHPSGLH